MISPHFFPHVSIPQRVSKPKKVIWLNLIALVLHLVLIYVIGFWCVVAVFGDVYFALFSGVPPLIVLCVSGPAVYHCIGLCKK